MALPPVASMASPLVPTFRGTLTLFAIQGRDAVSCPILGVAGWCCSLGNR